MAGLEGEDLIEAHGTFHTSHCVSFLCRKEYTMEWMKGAGHFLTYSWSFSPLLVAEQKWFHVLLMLFDFYLYIQLIDKIFAEDIPKCEACNSLVKPGEFRFQL